MPEVRRLLLAITEPPERVHVHLAWSAFRRRHQAVATQCHRIRRERSHPPQLGSPAPYRLSWSRTELTDARWERIAALLPPPSTGGRPAQDHRRLLAGMLWMMRSGATWREVPERFGPWHTVYTRYRQWCKAGIWHDILAALAPDLLTNDS
ncbi:MAG: hypothetical protein PVSMB7_29880 [Chloroflexota bacterium]